MTTTTSTRTVHVHRVYIRATPTHSASGTRC